MDDYILKPRIWWNRNNKLLFSNDRDIICTCGQMLDSLKDFYRIKINQKQRMNKVLTDIEYGSQN